MGQEVPGQFTRVSRGNIFTRDTALLILKSADSLVVNRAFEVIENYINVEKSYKFHLGGFQGYQCWDGAAEVLDKIYDK